MVDSCEAITCTLGTVRPVSYYYSHDPCFLSCTVRGSVVMRDM